MKIKVENLEHAAKLEINEMWDDLLAFSRGWTEEEPTNLFAWQAMGDSLRKLGRPTESISAYLRGLNVAPVQPVELFGRFLSAGPLWYRLAHAYSELGNFKEAIETFHKAVEVDPEVVDIWNDLGVAYSKIKDYKGALESFMKAVQLDSSNINSLKNFGFVSAMCGIENNVLNIHNALKQLDDSVASDFIVQARALLANR